MARILVSGQWFTIDDQGVEAPESELEALRPGEFTKVELDGPDGQELWIKIPAESSVAIQTG